MLQVNNNSTLTNRKRNNNIQQRNTKVSTSPYLHRTDKQLRTKRRKGIEKRPRTFSDSPSLLPFSYREFQFFPVTCISYESFASLQRNSVSFASSTNRFSSGKHGSILWNRETHGFPRTIVCLHNIKNNFVYQSEQR